MSDIKVTRVHKGVGTHNQGSPFTKQNFSNNGKSKDNNPEQTFELPRDSFELSEKAQAYLRETSSGNDVVQKHR